MVKGLFIGLNTINIQLYVKEYPESNTKGIVSSTRIDIGGRCTTSNEVINNLIDNNIRNIAITRGERSITIYTNGAKPELPVSSIIAVDTLGAGDILHGAFRYFINRDHNFVSALKKASVIASESCKYRGTKEWALNSDIIPKTR